MKTIKRSIALALALILTFAMSITAFADDAKTYSIKINNAVAGHTYEAYQILAGDLSENGQTLSNVKWGTGVNDDAQKSLGDAAAYAEKLAGLTSNSAELNAEADKISANLGTVAGSVTTEAGKEAVISGLEAGYYLIKDQDNSLAGTDKAYTDFILQVVADTEITPKSDVPSVEKKVQDANDTTGDTTDWQDSADYDIGDNVPFKLTATLGKQISTYDTYKIVFYDTISAGLTRNDDVKVTIDGVDHTNDFTISPVADGKFTVSCNDVKALGAHDNSEIVVTYSAQLNDNAVIGSAGNPNTVKLGFSNNPNYRGDGDNTPTGETPEDKVIVFTYRLVVNKIDGETKQPLSGAEFTLFKKVKGQDDVEIAKRTVNDAGTTFTFTGLDDGTYVLKETKTPDGYNSIEDKVFTISAKHDDRSDDPKLTELTGNAADGTVIDLGVVLTDGELNTNIENNKGSVLPSTGGAGRVAIYVIGAILVIGGGIVLVTKKRVR